MYLDFNAVAKGYAIDRMGVMLDRKGFYNYLIEVGGEVLVKGPSKIIYGGNDRPILSCGARVVIETESEIEIIR